jgi:hypothetical protein
MLLKGMATRLPRGIRLASGFVALLAACVGGDFETGRGEARASLFVTRPMRKKSFLAVILCLFMIAAPVQTQVPAPRRPATLAEQQAIELIVARFVRPQLDSLSLEGLKNLVLDARVYSSFRDYLNSERPPRGQSEAPDRSGLNAAHSEGHQRNIGAALGIDAHIDDKTANATTDGWRIAKIVVIQVF